jgi:hypothetical protein
MRRRVTWTRVGKWTGVVSQVVIIGLWFASRWWSLSLELGMKSDVAIIVVRNGRFIAECGPKKATWTGPSSGLHANAVAVDPSSRVWRWGLEWYLPIPVGRANSGLWLVYIPIYIPFAVLALPVAWMCYADASSRRRESGTCVTCGYDLAGNTSRVCPECGSPTTPCHTLNVSTPRTAK